MGRRRWRMLQSQKAAASAQAVERALEQAREYDRTTVVAPEPIKAVEPIIRNPVTIYENNRWVTVDKTARDFPYPVKMRITPEWAVEVVTERNDTNRSVRSDRVEKYIKDIIAGNWNIINNGIGFYENGQLADGQHRLWAVVEAQMPIEAIVLFGMDKKSISSIDEGAVRSTKDVSNMMGITVSNAALSITNYILEYRNLKRVTPRGEQIEFYKRHSEAVEFVVTRLKRRGICKAPVMAAIMRAWYSVDRQRLTEFLQVLDNGQMQSAKDSAAVTLREFLLRNNNNSGPFRAEMYRKTEAALVNFMNGMPISRLYGMEKEQFPLPEENVETGKPV